MKKSVHIFLIVMVLSLFMVNAAFASHGEPAGSCPPAFELHHMMEHNGEHMHQHIGADQDFNGDGYLCVKHLPNDFHLHVDNSIT